METADFALDDVLALGDVATWSTDDWVWDSKAFTATPLEGSQDRAAKRQCTAHPSFDFSPHISLQAPKMGPPESLSAYTDFCLPGIVHLETEGQKEVTPAAPVPADSERSSSCCQVETCGRDLSHLSTYHQRCRICEVHIKEGMFMRAGIVQRFCQQCGRCHPLDAFQGQKRSCIEQLAKHNARRRRRTDKKEGKATLPGPSEISLSQGTSNLDTRTAAGSDLIRPSSAKPTATTFSGLTSEAVSDYSALERDTQANPPAPSLPEQIPCSNEGLNNFMPPNACDCGCVTQSVKAGPAKRKTQSQNLAHSHADDFPGQKTNSQKEMSLQKHGTADPRQQDMDSFQLAMALMAGNQDTSQTQYRSQTLPMQLSVKLFQCTPADLPKDMRHQLTGWLNSAPAGAECLIRPGCVHLSLTLALTPDHTREVSESRAQSFIEHVQAQAEPFWGQHTAVIHAENEVAVIKQNRLQAIQTRADPILDSTQLQLHSNLQEDLLQPSTCLTKAQCIYLGESKAIRISLKHKNIKTAACTAHMNGKFLKCIHKSTNGQDAYLEIALPALSSCGALWLQIQLPDSALQTVLILLCPEQGMEAQLQDLARKDTESAEHLLQDLSVLMDDLLAPLSRRMLIGRLCSYACKADLSEVLGWLVCHHVENVLQWHNTVDLSMQHLCVLAQNLPSLKVLLNHKAFEVNPEGLDGITPLHLSALNSDPAFSKLIADYLPPDAWTETVCDDGQTPSDFALRAGNYGLDLLMREQAGVSREAVSAGESQHPEKKVKFSDTVQVGRSAQCLGLGRSNICMGRSAACLGRPTIVKSH